MMKQKERLMKRTIVVNVSNPQTFQIEIDDSISIDEIREKVKDHAMYLMETSPSKPIIMWSDWWDVVE